jgi:hypothetical protein
MSVWWVLQRMQQLSRVVHGGAMGGASPAAAPVAVLLLFRSTLMAGCVDYC